jgi:large repetitive protein
MRFLTIFLVALLAACGGGGGSGGNTPNGSLEVGLFGYQSTSATTYKEVSFAPTVSLDGNRATYRVVSGSLPAGLSLDPGTGVISGVLTGSGMSTARIELTVEGFSGSRPAMFSVSVNDTRLSYTGSSGSSSPSIDTTFEVGSPLRPFTVFLLDSAFFSNGSFGLGPLQPGPGVSITYRVANASALPNGLALDTSTGLISGTPTATGTVDTHVEALVTYQGTTRLYAAMIPFSITGPTASLSYAPSTNNGDLCISAPIGTPLTFAPVLSGGEPGDLLTNFTADRANLGGLSLDPTTGILSGTAFVNSLCSTVASQFDVTFTLTRGSHSNQITTHLIVVQ